MKIKKCCKLAYRFHIKEKYVMCVRIVKTSIKSWINVKNVQRIIEINKKAWLKSYTDMKAKLKPEAKNYFEKDLFKIMNNSVFGKTMEHLRKHKDMKLVTSKTKSYLVSERSYHTTKFFLENLLAIKLKKTKVNIN